MDKEVLSIPAFLARPVPHFLLTETQGWVSRFVQQDSVTQQGSLNASHVPVTLLLRVQRLLMGLTVLAQEKDDKLFSSQ